jgi:hypothetical protein
MSTFPTFSRTVEWEMEETIEDSCVQTALDSGHVHSRPKFTRDRKVWSGVTYRNLNETDRTNYLAFLAGVRGRSSTFTWNCPIDSTNYTVRFTSLPSLSRLIPGRYQISFGVVQE